MNPIRDLSDSTITLLLVPAILILCAFAFMSGMSIFPVAILFCLGLTSVLLWQSNRFDVFERHNETSTEPEPVDTVKQRYARGELSEDELETQISDALDGDEKSSSSDQREISHEERH